MEIMQADYEMLLRVPGIGPLGARRIVSARRISHLTYEDLKKMGIVLKRAQFFITCNGKIPAGLRFSAATLIGQLERIEQGLLPDAVPEQLSLFDNAG